MTAGILCADSDWLCELVLTRASGTVEILVDTVTLRENVIRFARNADWQADWTEQDGGFVVTATK